jgi:diguanylate cyclase (GGDEF)-like protein/putative nucleotidyltransferase with HDIG domain
MRTKLLAGLAFSVGILGLCAAVLSATWGQWIQAGCHLGVVILALVYSICLYYRQSMGQLEARCKQAEETSCLHLRTIKALALAIEAKEQSTQGHLERLWAYSMEMGMVLSLSDEEMEALGAAALLHDIGKLAVPEQIINKPGRLTPEEFDKMKIHPLIGAEILSHVNFPYPVVPIVEAHHERWDGAGYPFGKKGEEIPMGARILAVLDCLDALCSERQYRRALPMTEALELVVTLAGSQFDPKVVAAVKENHQRLRELTNTSGHRQQAAAGDDRYEKAMLTEGNFLTSIAAARQEAQMLYEISHDLGNSLSLDETLSLLSVRLRRLVPYDSIVVYVKSENQLLPQHIAGDHFRVLSSLTLQVGQGLSGWVAEKGTPILNGNPALEFGSIADRSRVPELKSAVSIPLNSPSATIGVLTLYRAGAEAFNRDNLRILLAISSKVALSVENALRFQQAESSATTDYLTGLPNARSLFMHLDEEISRCKREGNSLAIMVCDLDGFKLINDQFGHLEGNKVLHLFAQLLRSASRTYDYVGRMGGDEFVIIAPGLKADAAAARAERMYESALEAGTRIYGEPMLSVSVGSAFLPEDGDDAEQLLAVADQRMYAQKQQHYQQHYQGAKKLIAFPTSASG